MYLTKGSEDLGELPTLLFCALKQEWSSVSFSWEIRQPMGLRALDFEEAVGKCLWSWPLWLCVIGIYGASHNVQCSAQNVLVFWHEPISLQTQTLCVSPQSPFKVFFFLFLLIYIFFNMKVSL